MIASKLLFFQILADIEEKLAKIENYLIPKMQNGITSERILIFTIFIRNGMNMSLITEVRGQTEERANYFSMFTNKF